jgi:hypothetical protein
MEKHTAYYNLIEQLELPGCPVCEQVSQSMRAFLDSYLYESVNDRDGWNRLVASDGYCARHCSMMEDFSDGLAVSLFYGHLYKESLKQLGKKEKEGLFSFKKDREPCPACVYEADIEAGQIRLFIKAMGEAEFLKAYESSNGLCLLHTRQACLASGAPLKALKTMAAKKLGPLIAEMDEYVRKSDHRNSEKMGPEGDGWRRALKRFHGIRYRGGK